MTWNIDEDNYSEMTKGIGGESYVFQFLQLKKMNKIDEN